MNIDDQKNIATQSNHLVESRYFLTIGEQKIMLLLISMISPDDVEFKEYEMQVMDFANIMGISGHSIYERLSDTLDKLLSRVIHIRKNTGYLKIGWVSSAEYIEGEGLVRISFDKKLKPYLLGLKHEFTKYKLNLVTQFSSSYTIRIYMLLKQYEKIGYRNFSVPELKKTLNIGDKRYKLYKEFNRNVIGRAKREFETIDSETGFYKSDITFDLETFRTGRKITDLKFIIKKQKTQDTRTIKTPLMATKPKDKPAKPKALKPDNKPNIKPKTLSPAVQALSRHNIKESLAATFETDQGEAAILNCIQLYEEKLAQGKINDLSGGYLISMLEAKAGIKSQAEIEAKQQEELKKQAQINKELEKRLKEYEHNVTVHFQREVKKQFIANLSPSDKEALLQKLEPYFNNMHSYLKQTDNRLENPAIATELNKHIPNYEERKTRYINLKMAQKRAELFGDVDDF